MGASQHDIEKWGDGHHKFERVLRDADQFKARDEVFDYQTLRFIYDVFKRKHIETVDFPLSTGKEANIYLCTTPEKQRVILKIFRTTTATFKSFLPYLEGDKRFTKIGHDIRGLVYSWSMKEFKNLKRLEEAGVRAPRPIFCYKNLLLMGYVKLDEDPAPTLKKALMDPADAREIGGEVLDMMRVMYKKAELVHSDLSEYNILVSSDGPTMIDVSQSVLVTHPHARDYLDRDVHNIVRFFNGYDMGLDPEKVLGDITGP